MSKGIRISKKHGLNPSVTHCECCGKEIGLAFFGQLKGDVEAPRMSIWVYVTNAKVSSTKAVS